MPSTARRQVGGHFIGAVHVMRLQPCAPAPAMHRADASAGGKTTRIAAAELECNRVLGGIEPQQPPPVAVQHRAGRQHLGIKQRAAREQTMEEPAMPIGPFHHRSDRKSAGPTLRGFFYFFNHFVNSLSVRCRTISGSF